MVLRNFECIDVVFVYCNQAFFVILLKVNHIPKFNFFCVQCWVGPCPRKLITLFALSALRGVLIFTHIQRVEPLSAGGFCLHADVFVIRRCMHIPRLIEQ